MYTVMSDRSAVAIHHRFKTLYWIVFGIMLLVLCGMVGFIIGRGTAPIPHYGNNSLAMAAGRWDFPAPLDGCEKLATAALEKARMPFIAVPGNRSVSANHTQSIQLYTSRVGMETPNGQLPFASAMVVCDTALKQMLLVVADHAYHHHDLINNFRQSLDQESRPN